MREWQPIDTAPSGEPVLVYNGEHIAVGEKTKDNWFIAESFGYNEDGEIYGITHWMPLPEPPQ